MSMRETILSEMRKIAQEQDIKLPPLTNDLSLLESGLDSLAFAILVTRLEDELGFDPFTEANDSRFPVTLGDLVDFYETAVTRA